MTNNNPNDPPTDHPAIMPNVRRNSLLQPGQTFVDMYHADSILLPASFRDTLEDKPQIYQRMRYEYWRQLSKQQVRQSILRDWRSLRCRMRYSDRCWTFWKNPAKRTTPLSSIPRAMETIWTRTDYGRKTSDSQTETFLRAASASCPFNSAAAIPARAEPAGNLLRNRAIGRV